MLQTLNCIRMGEVLLDENLQLFILCNNCHTDLRNLPDFRQHLEKCEGLENLFQKGQQQIKYNSDKSTQLFGKTLKGIKEFLIYDYNDVEITYTKMEENFIDLINIEEELLDPKWYSDLNNEVSSCNSSSQKSSKQYDELVEAVTPFVQFKENLKTNNNHGKKSSTQLKVINKDSEKSLKNVQFDLTANKTKPTAKRKLSMAKTIPIQFAVPSPPVPTQINVANHNLSNCTTTSTPVTKVSKTYNFKKRKTESTTSNGFIKQPDTNKPLPINTPKITNILPSTNITTNIVLNPISCKTTATTIPTTTLQQEPTKEKQTAQILNKLQNLGLQVKRTQPLPQPVMANSAASNKTDTKTLEILQKLQSKGMKVKILNKQQSTSETSINNTMTKPLPALVSNPVQKSLSVIRNPAANIAIKQNLNKNLIIRKVN